LIIRPCKELPLTRGRSMRRCSKIKSDNCIIVGLRRASPDLSLRKWVTLKSPPMHHNKFYHLSKLANSSHSNLLSPSDLGPKNPAKAQEKPIFDVSKRAGNRKIPHTLRFSPQPSYPTRARYHWGPCSSTNPRDDTPTSHTQHY
jgi:hypothetical protein